MVRAGTNTCARMTAWGTRERGNGEEPIRKDVRISQGFGILVSRKRAGTKTRRNARGQVHRTIMGE